MLTSGRKYNLLFTVGVVLANMASYTFLECQRMKVDFSIPKTIYLSTSERIGFVLIIIYLPDKDKKLCTRNLCSIESFQIRKNDLLKLDKFNRHGYL